MEFIAELRRRTEAFDAASFDALADSEAERVRRLYTDGIVRQIWSRGDQPGAVMLIEAVDEPTARAAVQSLPFHQANMLEITLLAPLLPYRGFAPRPTVF
jgi:muconolactone delta-isomerase